MFLPCWIYTAHRNPRSGSQNSALRCHSGVIACHQLPTPRQSQTLDLLTAGDAVAPEVGACTTASSAHLKSSSRPPTTGPVVCALGKESIQTSPGLSDIGSKWTPIPGDPKCHLVHQSKERLTRVR